jgi:hypothetical protein
MQKRILLFFLVCIPWRSFSQAFTVSTDKQRILLGEPLHLKLQANFSVTKPKTWFRIDSFPHFEILDSSVIDTVQKGNVTTLTREYILTSWDSGSWQIPPLYLSGNKSAPIKIDIVFTSPFDPNQPYHDIRDILDVKKPIESKWYWYLIFLGILIILFLLFFPKGKKKVKPAFETDPGAYQTAMKKLESLQKQDNADPKFFYTELINIFRTYLHKRKNIQSFSKTTDDLAAQMKNLQLDETIQNPLLQSLRLSDMVKFARYKPDKSEQQQSVEIIRDSITQIEQVPHAI